MNRETRNQIIGKIRELLESLQDEETMDTPPATKTMEMITIKEAVMLVKGVSEHTIRKIVAQKKVYSIRTGEGEHGKILICKQSLLDYFNGTE